MTLPIIIVCGGGHAGVLISMLRVLGRTILGITDAAPEKRGMTIKGLSVLGNDDIILDYAPNSVELVNGMGSVSSMEKRKEVYLRFKASGYSFARLIHPQAMVMEDVTVAEGVQIMAGAIIQTGSVIGENSIINTGAIVDHDCRIDEHVHVAPGAVLSGGVQIGAMTHIGTSATVIQGVKIGCATVVGAGAVVIDDVRSGVKVIGVPAKEMRP